jgi:hypothetical protein
MPIQEHCIVIVETPGICAWLLVTAHAIGGHKHTAPRSIDCILLIFSTYHHTVTGGRHEIWLHYVLLPRPPAFLNHVYAISRLCLFLSMFVHKQLVCSLSGTKFVFRLDLAKGGANTQAGLADLEPPVKMKERTPGRADNRFLARKPTAFRARNQQIGSSAICSFRKATLNFAPLTQVLYDTIRDSGGQKGQGRSGVAKVDSYPK